MRTYRIHWYNERTDQYTVIEVCAENVWDAIGIAAHKVAYTSVDDLHVKKVEERAVLWNTVSQA